MLKVNETLSEFTGGAATRWWCSYDDDGGGGKEMVMERRCEVVVRGSRVWRRWPRGGCLGGSEVGGVVGGGSGCRLSRRWLPAAVGVRERVAAGGGVASRWILLIGLRGAFLGFAGKVHRKNFSGDRRSGGRRQPDFGGEDLRGVCVLFSIK
nr:hypothetical protein [Tanacetum cinerariifolium]